jgi:hypothetical protein
VAEFQYGGVPSVDLDTQLDAAFARCNGNVIESTNLVLRWAEQSSEIADLIPPGGEESIRRLMRQRVKATAKKATTTKRPPQVGRPGDLAFVAGAGTGELPLYRITDIETGIDGRVTYYVSAATNPRKPGQPVPAERVIGVFSNILNQE